jgi:hypothetical protein
MAKSNAQRQQEYREKQKEHDAEKSRIDMYVDLHAKLAIEKLARHYEMSKIGGWGRFLPKTQLAYCTNCILNLKTNDKLSEHR